MMLALNVPEPITGRSISVETNPKAVKAWLVSLPPANLNESARAIFDALTKRTRYAFAIAWELANRDKRPVVDKDGK